MNIYKPELPFLVFWSGTRCSLRCRDCCNLIPYMPQVSFDWLECMKDLVFLSSKITVRQMQLQGGEIFTHPDADKIIAFAGKLDIPKITLTTNGTITLSDKIISVLQQNPHISVTVSNYECTEKKRAEVVRQLREANITHKVYEFCLGDNAWFKTGGPLQQAVSTTKMHHNFFNCLEKFCPTLADGILYFCGKARAINMFHEVEDCGFSTVNLRAWRNGADQSERLAKYFMLKNSVKPECAYCSINKGEKIKPAEQLDPKEFKEIMEQLPG